MIQPKNVCVLVAEVPGRQRFAEALGAHEVNHAVERCMHRVERAIEANAGARLRRETARACAAFERCDAAILAACEMLERVESLPPLRGLRMLIRVGVHYGAAAPGPAVSADEALAMRLADTAKPGHILASNAVVMQLSPGVRHLACNKPLQDSALDGLGWPVFEIVRYSGTITSIPAAERISQRLRIHHQQDVLFVEENRPVVLLGREIGNDIVIIDRRTSRQHARIERRREGFVLIDRSTNGTYVAENGGAERCIKAGELPLIGPGRIGCGFSANDIERDLAFFEIV
ncbi:FHA domain-containing protein [Aromatoleum buckelii]|uniref:FHA domain-containing protein n=1 Tax=Aromatoleum buckelii TaxID=200254 RepID=A0ABX1N2A3_9RHOO|nr:FHA domain-containing protein [Aromatoleum buckelii]MCK0509923.1 FHA domain-containing protein [Aromatoleum buckelii]